MRGMEGFTESHFVSLGFARRTELRRQLFSAVDGGQRALILVPLSGLPLNFLNDRQRPPMSPSPSLFRPPELDC